MQPSDNAIVEVLAIGREILDGRVIDTNSVWLAEKLKERGLIPRYGQRVDDDFERVIEAFEIARKRSHIILVTGGLGPTADDLTAEAFGRFIGEPLELNPVALAQVEGWFERMKRPLLDVQKKQAYFSKSCRILENFEGTAPGFSKRFAEGLNAGQVWYFMPGVPKEMKRMVEAHVLPELPKVEGYQTSSWATQFTSEGELQKRLAPVHQAIADPKLQGFEITYRTRFPENHIGLHGVCVTPERREAYRQQALQIEKLLGDDVFSGSVQKELRPLEVEVMDLLKKAHAIVSTVESCTGGLVASRLTDVPGSSQSYWASWLTYDNSAKEALGVPHDLLVEKGAVSSETALSLAQAGLKKLKALVADSARGRPLICISTTGIAGPDGGSDEKPVGLCYVAIASEGLNGQPMEQAQEIRGRAFLKRSENKLLFSQKALDLLRRHLK
jgi:nicotinamide-nucleotide amidase